MENQILTPKLAKQILADATSLGLPVEDYLERVIQTDANGAGEKPFYETASAEEWTKALNDLARKSPQYAPPLSDEAISRESIYREREDNQL